MPTSNTPPAFNRLVDSEDSMKHDHHFAKMARFFAALAWLIGVVACPAFGQNIIDQWSDVQVPSPPELNKVTVDPKSTALLMMGFVRDSRNAQRRPRCVATIPHVKKLLTEARAHGVLVLHSVPCSDPSGDFIVEDLAPLPGEAIIGKSPNKAYRFVDHARYMDA